MCTVNEMQNTMYQSVISIGYRLYITIINELSGNERSDWTIYFLFIVICALWPTYTFLLLSSDCSFGNGRIDHLTDLLNDKLNRDYKKWRNMWLSWKNI